MPDNGVYTEEELALVDEYASGENRDSTEKSKHQNLKVWSEVEIEEPVAEGSNVQIRSKAVVGRKDGTGREWEICPTFPALGVDLPLRLWSIDEGFAQVLTGLVRAIKPRVCLEVGTNYGRSARAISEGLVANGYGSLTTVDMMDHQIHESGALLEDQKTFVNQVIGKTPEIYKEFPLADMKNIDFAFLDGEHKAKGVEEDLQFVEDHRASECLVLLDNARDPSWPEVEEFFGGYGKYPHICLNTISGTQMIWMRD